MSTPKRTAPCTQDCWEPIETVAQLLRDAERVIVGVGAGLSAAGGLDYASRALAQTCFPEYVDAGCNSVAEVLGLFWRPEPDSLERYWGCWARHIRHIRYESAATRPYLDLFALLRGRDYFILSTNVDGQLQKAGFPRQGILAPQGDYALFQCAVPCSDEVYDNREMVERMVANMTGSAIRPGDIPQCPRCGASLVPNLRCDDKFVERPHLWNLSAYDRYVDDARGKKLLLLELGVGYNTPAIIRFPFERMTAHFPHAHLVRVNTARPDIPRELSQRATGIREDLGEVLHGLRRALRA